MENFRKEEHTKSGGRIMTTTLAERLRRLEEKERLKDRSEESEERTRFFKWPWKWRRRFNQTKKARYRDMMLVFFLNKKNEIEPPKFMPIFDGNMIVWKNKPYEFDPRAIWTLLGVKKNTRAYLIKEIDRRPVRNRYGKIVYRDASVSNMDIDEIRERGDSTESDEFLIKAALKAQTAQIAKRKVSTAVIIAILVALGLLVWFFLKG